MYSRDPFNVRRNSPVSDVFRSNNPLVVRREAHTWRNLHPNDTFVSSALARTPNATSVPLDETMSSYDLPNGSTANISEAWQSSGRSRFHHDAESSSISEKVSHILSPRDDSLPMYKDKPYHHSGGHRRWMIWIRQKRRVLAITLLGFAFLSYWFGILSPLALFTDPGTRGNSLSWLLGGDGELIDWDERAEQVKEAFKISFSGYEKYGWGYDEYHPISHSGKFMTPKGLGWIIVDALDTMMLMNLTTELAHARQWIHSNLTYDQDHDVNTFETTIRMLGGLLSAHYLSTDFPGIYAPVDDGLSDDLYIEKASDLADRLLGAYESTSGVPFASINLHTMSGIPSHADGGASSTAEATTLQLEMKYLSKLTGETTYWEKAEQVMKVVDDNHMPDGLVPIYIHPQQGVFRGENIRLGSRGDSYYEYLIKQYLQTSREEPVYQAMWKESLAGVKKHLLTYSHPHNFTVLGERPSGLSRELSPKVDHLVCFMPGTIALATTGGLPLKQARQQPSWGDQQEEDMKLAEELMKTCWGMYKLTPSGLAPEITHFNLYDPPLMYDNFTSATRPKSPESFEECANARCTSMNKVGGEDYTIKGADVHNLQRPETVESLFYMWRITGEEKYRKWGWEMFQAFIRWSAVEDGTGFSSTANVLHTPPGFRDNMESFWLVSARSSYRYTYRAQTTC